MTDPQTPSAPEPAPSPDATQKLPAGVPQDPRSTVRMEGLPPVVEDAGRTQKLPPPPEILRPAAPQGSRLWLTLGGLAVLAVLGGGGYLLFFRGTGAPAPLPAAAAETVPAGVQTYLDQARAGDAHAMRMLGVMYYYGLNVPQDREKGIYWYRQAAEKGSDAARKDLAKLQAGSAK